MTFEGVIKMKLCKKLCGRKKGEKKRNILGKEGGG